jgi:ferrous iron transport protein B
MLGLPLAMVDAIILSLVRHEAAAGLIIKLIEKGQLDFVQSIVAVLLTTMFVPCFANIIVINRQIGIKKTMPMIASINVSAVSIAGAMSWILVSLF